MKTYRHQQIRSIAALKKAGLTKIRSQKAGSHVVRIAYPPGRRRKGSGRVASILHPRNPPLTKIYERIGEIRAQKGPGHQCSPSCKSANHWYVHKFTSPASVYGTADGKTLIIK